MGAFCCNVGRELRSLVPLERDEVASPCSCVLFDACAGTLFSQEVGDQRQLLAFKCNSSSSPFSVCSKGMHFRSLLSPFAAETCCRSTVVFEVVVTAALAGGLHNSVSGFSTRLRCFA